MIADGHEVVCFAPGGFSNGQFTYYDKNTGYSWEVLSACFGDARGGDDAFPYWMRAYNDIDVIIPMLDPCVMEYLTKYDTPIYSYGPIDTTPINAQEANILSCAEKILIPSKWGVSEATRIGLSAEYVPYGVETSDFYYSGKDRELFRSELGIDENTFLIGMVGVHYKFPDRKGYSFALQAIQQFVANHPNDNIKAFIQIELKNEDGYLDLRGLRKTLGLEGIVGFSRSMGPRYLDDNAMRQRFCGFDVLLQTSLTEGFCLPLVEAQSCGTPVIINNCTAMTENVGPFGLFADPAMSMVGPDGTLCFLPNVNNLTQALEMSFEDWQNGTVNRNLLSGWTHSRYDYDMIYNTYWKNVLSSAPKKIDIENLEPRLNIGCGTKPMENSINHDLTKHSEFVDVAHDLNVFPYPWNNDQFGFIFMNDVIEHLDTDIHSIMNELWRITKPEGILFICTVETGSWQHLTDPTHKRGFTINSFDYFDDTTELGKEFGSAYELKPWRIVKRNITDSGELVFYLQAVK